MIVCYRCFNESAVLKAKFRADGVRGACDVCKCVRAQVLDASDLTDLFVGLSRLYQVAQQGEHYHRDYEDGDEFELGDTGESLPKLLQDEWPIFADGMEHGDIDAILHQVWPDYSGDLYAKEALWDRDPDDEWESIKRHVMHERRFFQNESDFDFTSLPSLLQPYMKRLTTERVGGAWVRARIQQKPDKSIPASEMGAPPKEQATAGRANPAGIPYLYLASDDQTACAEVRAEPGHGVTIGKFRIAESVKLLDVATIMRGIDPFAHIDLKCEMERSNLVRAFAHDLSRPVLAEDATLSYVPTQYLAEYFAASGFDGIRYRSSVAVGTNLVLFDPAKARLVSTHSVQIAAKRLTIVDPRRKASKRRILRHRRG
jgi:hypothetical protein